MRVHDLNEELLNELNMDDVKKGAKKVVDGAKEAMTNVVKIVKDEIFDNKMAFGIVYKKLMGGEVSPEDFKKAKDQLLKDNAKILTMGALGVLPGSVVAVPIAMKIAAQFGIDLKPSKTFA